MAPSEQYGSNDYSQTEVVSACTESIPA